MKIVTLFTFVLATVRPAVGNSVLDTKLSVSVCFDPFRSYVSPINGVRTMTLTLFRLHGTKIDLPSLSNDERGALRNMEENGRLALENQQDTERELIADPNLRVGDATADTLDKGNEKKDAVQDEDENRRNLRKFLTSKVLTVQSQ